VSISPKTHLKTAQNSAKQYKKWVMTIHLGVAAVRPIKTNT
jgi:hypothetical protein